MCVMVDGVCVCRLCLHVFVYACLQDELLQQVSHVPTHLTENFGVVQQLDAAVGCASLLLFVGPRVAV